MDKVQIYACCIIALCLIVGIATDGKPKKELNHSFVTTFIGLLMSLPMYGRVFGWW